MGACTRNYLLERTRVSAAPQGERNYHSFYQLLAGTSAAELQLRKLKAPSHYTMLLPGGRSATQRPPNGPTGDGAGSSIAIEGVDDAHEWRVTSQAMEELGFSKEEHGAIVDILAALLHLGSLEFALDASVTNADDASKLVDQRPAEEAAALLCVDRHSFVGALTGVRVRDMQASLSVDAAAKNRDAFVAAAYAALFDWLVMRINHVGAHAADDLGSARYIGVLDIFGFEIFATNSLEQLCINFANEKLQRNFTMTTFAQEEGLYDAEGIVFEHIPYADNLPVLELLDCASPRRRGILQLLDEEVRLPRTSDATLLAKMNGAFAPSTGMVPGKGGNHAAYEVDFRQVGGQAGGLFTIKHYAGDVRYSISGFLEKSVENISSELVGALLASSNTLAALLFQQTSARANEHRAHGNGKAANGKAAPSGTRKPTVGVKFASQLAALIEMIEATDAHFIRCIKPNATKAAAVFEAKLTLEQLRCVQPSSTCDEHAASNSTGVRPREGSDHDALREMLCSHVSQTRF